MKVFDVMAEEMPHPGSTLTGLSVSAAYLVMQLGVMALGLAAAGLLALLSILINFIAAVKTTGLEMTVQSLYVNVTVGCVRMVAPVSSTRAMLQWHCAPVLRGCLDCAASTC